MLQKADPHRRPLAASPKGSPHCRPLAASSKADPDRRQAAAQRRLCRHRQARGLDKVPSVRLNGRFTASLGRCPAPPLPLPAGPRP
eukprot:228388-Chlamydomonas_euryale.AAC.4